MPGLAVNGIISIPNEHNLRYADAGKGKWLNFRVYYSDKDYKGDRFNHVYKVSMWVTETEINKCLDMIKPGRFFRITGHIDARQRDDGNDPIPQIRVDYKFFEPTKIGKIE